MTFISVIDHLGTFAFAISGIRAASSRGFDLFGAYVIALATAIGGGTLRDLLLDLPPFWMQHPSYLLVTGIALLLMIVIGEHIIRRVKTLFLADALGLGLFVVVGIDKAIGAGSPFWVAIIMGLISGCVGGIIRDILVNDEPLIFREDLYATTCLAGGLVYFACLWGGFPASVTQLAAAATVIVFRVAAVKYHLHLPKLTPLDR